MKQKQLSRDKRINRIASKRGFTLAEVLIAAFITAVLIACVFAFMTPVRDFTASVHTDAYVQTLLDNYGKYIRNKTDSSKELIITTDKSKALTDYKLLYIDSADKYKLYDFGALTDSMNVDTCIAVKETYRVFNDAYYVTEIQPKNLEYDEHGNVTDGGFIIVKDNILRITLHPKDKALYRKTTYRLNNLIDNAHLTVDCTTDPSSGEYTLPIYILYKD